ncbi:50S ribosomal protein L10, partial [Bacteroides heparinolyticus]
MRKEDKGAVIGQLTEYIGQYPHFYLTDIAALNAEKTSQLRRNCNKNGVKLVLVKNTLLRAALAASDV